MGMPLGERWNPGARHAGSSTTPLSESTVGGSSPEEATRPSSGTASIFTTPPPPLFLLLSHQCQHGGQRAHRRHSHNASLVYVGEGGDDDAAGEGPEGKVTGVKRGRPPGSKGPRPDSVLTGEKRARAVKLYMDEFAPRKETTHRRTQLEFAALVFDPLTQRTETFVSSGLRGAWGTVDSLEDWSATLYNYNMFCARLQASSLELISWDPLYFDDLPGLVGKDDVQRALTWVLLQLAMPGKRSRWWRNTTAEELRTMRCELD